MTAPTELGQKLLILHRERQLTAASARTLVLEAATQAAHEGDAARIMREAKKLAVEIPLYLKGKSPAEFVVWLGLRVQQIQWHTTYIEGDGI